MPRESGSRATSRISTARPRFTIGSGFGLLLIGLPLCPSSAAVAHSARNESVTTTSDVRMSDPPEPARAYTSPRAVTNHRWLCALVYIGDVGIRGDVRYYRATNTDDLDSLLANPSADNLTDALPAG